MERRDIYGHLDAIISATIRTVCIIALAYISGRAFAQGFSDEIKSQIHTIHNEVAND